MTKIPLHGYWKGRVQINQDKALPLRDGIHNLGDRQINRQSSVKSAMLGVHTGCNFCMWFFSVAK